MRDLSPDSHVAYSFLLISSASDYAWNIAN